MLHQRHAGGRAAAGDDVEDAGWEAALAQQLGEAPMLGPWFNTGDRYLRREDGVYAYVGRIDDMFKVGGLWVSPVDMEQVLMEHPRVAGVGVVGVLVEGTTRLAAFVECPGGGDEALAEEPRALCEQRLRRYEYPHMSRSWSGCRAR